MKKLITPSILFCIALFACNPKTDNSKTTSNDDANKALIETYYKHFNAHDWKAMSDLYVDTPEMKDPSIGIDNVKMSRAEIEKKYTELGAMIPDVRDSIVRMYSIGDVVVVEFESSGTGPDGKKFRLPICTVFEIKEGRIGKDLTYFDN